MPVKMENICKQLNKYGADKFLQSRLRKAVDVQRVTADKEGEALDALGLAVWIRAVKAADIAYLAHLRLTAADRTFLRNPDLPASGQVIGNLRDNHVGLINRDGVALAQSQGLHNA